MVINSAPEYDRRNGVKNADVDTSLPLEKASGFYWDTENGISRFKIVLKEKSMTTRRTLSLISSIFEPPGFAVPQAKGHCSCFAKMKLVRMKWLLMTSLENGSFCVRLCTV